MKTLIYILVFLIPYSLSAQCSDLNYSNFVKIFEDEFDSYDCSSIYAFQSDPTFIAKWDVTNGCWGAGNEYYYPSNVTMNTCGIISFTENNIFPTFSVTCNGITREVTKSSGTLISKTGYYGYPSNPTYAGYGYGIFEASIRLPSETSIDCGNSGGAFWTGGVRSNEIDVIDDAHQHGGAHRVFDYEYSPAYNESIDPPIIPDLSIGFHKFSCVWTPSEASFFIDECFRGTIPYTSVRTFEDFVFLKLALLSCSAIPPGLVMDVDWVKVWRPKCSGTDLNVIDIACCGLFPTQIPPGMQKHKSINSSSTSTNLSASQVSATVFEAEVTKINANFIADESALTYVTGTSRISNGFFEIRPIICGSETANWYKNIDTTSIYQSSRLDNSNMPMASDQLLTTENYYPITSRFTFNLYPNPAQDKINITYSCKSSGLLDIRIKDVSDRIIYAEQVTCNEGTKVQHSVDISSFVKGMYFIDITLNEQHYTTKFAKL